jgi:ubiquinone/menaquinone biosynthesis C-methylase UbiE
VPVNESVIDHAGIRPGEVVLDVATGTGHAAIAAARQGGRVTGIDYVPALLDIARRRATAEQIDVDFVESSAEHLPFADATFDVAVSALGIMFTADHQGAADELARVVRPGGRISLANWTAEGFIGGMLGIVGRHAAPPPGAQSPVRWGNADIVRELFAGTYKEFESVTHSLTVRFASPEAFADLFIASYGPTHSASKRLSPEGQQAMYQELVDHAAAADRSGDEAGIVLDWEYRVVTATRR